MITLKNLTKSFQVGNQRKYVARNIDAVFPEKTSVALLGRNGAGKSTLLKVIGGTMAPDYGRVLSAGRISWQIGFAGSFHPDLTGAQNTRFIARIYGVDTESLMHYVQDFAELGASFYMPFRTYSSGMRARFAFGVSMGIPFSYYLIDEVTSVGDASFKAKCSEVLKEKLAEAGAIVVSHSDATLRSLCTAGAVLEAGVLTYYDDVEAAIEHHNRNMGAAARTRQMTDKGLSSARDLYLAGRQNLTDGDIGRAIAQIESAVAAEPANAGWQAGLGAALMKAERYDDALAAFGTAIQLEPDNSRHRLSASSVLLKLGRHADALEVYRVAAQINPSSVAAWVGMARSASAIGAEDEALRAYTEVVKLDPDNLAAHTRLAAEAVKDDDEDAARHHLGRIADLRHDHVPSQLAHARSLMTNGQFADAATRFRRVLELQPDHPSAAAILEELNQWGSEGDPARQAASQAYYDAIYAGDNHYQRDGTNMRVDAHFVQVCDLLQSVDAQAVLDIGCGPGQFAQFMRAKLPVPYHGIDFSTVAIESARNRQIPSAQFSVLDVTSEPLPAVTKGTAIVCTEVLEHIIDDLGLIGKFPEGHYCCCSVPNFYTFSHVRYFKSECSVADRYGRFFDDFKVEKIVYAAGPNCVYLFSGRRNGVTP